MSTQAVSNTGPCSMCASNQQDHFRGIGANVLWRCLPAIAARLHIKGSGVANSLSARTGQKTTNQYRDLVLVPIVDGPDQRRTYTIARLHNCSRRYIPPLAL